jgi:hypothetical protein
MSTVDQHVHRWRHGPSYLISLHNYMRAQAHRKHVMEAACDRLARRENYNGATRFVHGTVLRRLPHETTTLYVLRRIPFSVRYILSRPFQSDPRIRRFPPRRRATCD